MFFLVEGKVSLNEDINVPLLTFGLLFQEWHSVAVSKPGISFCLF